MPLSAGDKLGPYEITSLLGKGGMGEVYRATDTRLHRDVAIKISAGQFSDRFEREARTVASLSHANIGHLYDIGPNYLVLELVEGETLADLIERGPIPIEEAIRIARQIADALDAAHEKSIVHRDLKPANIKIKPDGTVKVLDFGLAKLNESTPASNADSPTFTMLAPHSPTEVGVILGTAAYMAPEQARGKPVDKRADIWAFGVVLHEMLTGRRAFTGETMTDILASVVKEQPDLDSVPARIKPVLERCLTKDPRMRWGDIGDVRWLLDSLPTAQVPVPPSPARRTPWFVAGLVTLVAVALLVALWAPWRTSAPRASMMRFEIPIPEQLNMSGDASFSLSPDGSKLAYWARGADGAMRLWVRAMDTLESHALAGTEVPGATPAPPFWSPDSRWIGFMAASQVKKIDSDGGPSQTLCDTTILSVGGSWNRDGVILLGGIGGPLMRVAATGGAASPVSSLSVSRKETAHLFPVFLPDGRHFLFLRTSSVPENNGIYLGSLDAKPDQQGSSRLVATDFAPVLAPSPNRNEVKLLVLRDGALQTQTFNLMTLQMTGDPVTVAKGVGYFLGFGFFTASTNGTLIYRGGSGYQRYQLTWFDRQGKTLGTEGEPDYFFDRAVLSQDGKQAAVTLRRSSGLRANLWLLDLPRAGAATRFTFFERDMDRAPVWSPDGTRIVFASNRNGMFDLYRKPTNGTRDEEVLLRSDESKTSDDWSPDGHYLLYESYSPKTRHDLWILADPGSATSSGKPMLFQGTDGNEHDGKFSPDGRWVAYGSDESGLDEIYVRELVLSANGSKLEPTAKRQISTSGGTFPSWRRDGKELIYLSNDQRTVMSAEIVTGPVFRAASPKALFQLPQGALAPAVTADGQRFLTAVPVQRAAPEPFMVVVNWSAAGAR